MIPILVPITDMKRQAGKVLDALRRDRTPMVITEHGRAAAVILDMATYETLTRRYEVLKALDEAEQDIAHGRVHSWDEVKADLAKWRP